jgi:hypothetical protein
MNWKQAIFVIFTIWSIINFVVINFTSTEQVKTIIGELGYYFIIITIVADIILLFFIVVLGWVAFYQWIEEWD